MTALAVDVHGDDLILFAAFTCLREKPRVIVFKPTVPLSEIDDAMDVLGLSWTTAYSRDEPELVIAPKIEKKSHDEHNQAGEFARGAFTPERRIDYLTYAPRGQRSRNGTEVVPTAREIALKLRALSCFKSQIEQPSTRPWFYELLDMREWVA